MNDEEDIVDKLTNHPFIKNGDMNDLLGLSPVEVKQYMVEMREDGNDLETAREELHDILSGLKTSFYQQLEQAAQVSLPRAHEVIATTAEKRIHAAQALIELQEIRGGPGEDAKIINGTMQISSAQMLDLIRDQIDRAKDNAEE